MSQRSDDKNGVLLPTAVYREVIRLTEGIQQSQTKYDAIDQLHAFARFVLKHAPPSTTPAPASSELARLREFQRNVEEAEARCCPEDVGFEEYIGILTKRLAAIADFDKETVELAEERGRASVVSAINASDYEEVLADHRRLCRELDAILSYPDEPARQASLCDLIPFAKGIAANHRRYRWLRDGHYMGLTGEECDKGVDKAMAASDGKADD